jgi:hypothetical protein
MSNTTRTFNSLPPSLQNLAIQLVIIRAQQFEDANLRNLVEEAVLAAGAGLEVGVMPEVAVDPAKPGEEQTAYQQTEFTGANLDYKDPEIFDPKNQDDAIYALSYLFSALRNTAMPEKHCGRTNCEVCNALFGKPEEKQEVNKLRFQQVDHKEGAFGPVDIYRSALKENVYAIMNRGKTALVESSNIELMTYQAAVRIVREHGKEGRSIVG